VDLCTRYTADEPLDLYSNADISPEISSVCLPVQIDQGQGHTIPMGRQSIVVCVS